MVSGGKITNRENLKRVAEQTDRDPEKLYKLPEIPNEIAYLRRWFSTLRGKDPLTFSEIQAWDTLNGHGITPHEVDALMAIDHELIKIQNG
jgi:hypothetical protein